MIYTFPGRSPACLEFIRKIKEDDDHGIVIDNEGNIIKDYYGIKWMPGYQTSDLCKHLIKNTIHNDDKILRCCSKVKRAILDRFRDLRISESDIVYFCVAGNSTKLFAYSESLQEKTIQDVMGIHPIEPYYIPDNKWRGV